MKNGSKIKRKLIIFIISLPLMIYSFLLSSNNIFGVPNPAGAGYFFMMGIPIYVFEFYKSVREYIKILSSNK